MYLDVYFVINWALNCCALTGAAAGYPVRGRRIVLSGAVGALGACLWVWLDPSQAWQPVGAVLLSMIMLQCCIGCRPRRQWLASLFRMYACSFFMAGVLPVVSRYIPLWLGSVLTAYAMLQLALKWSGRKKGQTAKLRIRCGEQEWCVQALIDSGHLLKEPVTGKPVILVQASSLPGHPEASYPLPFQTVQGCSLLLGFWPDRVWVGAKEYRAKEVLIGVTSQWKSAKYQALLPGYLYE